MKTFLWSLVSLSILSASCSKEVKYTKEIFIETIKGHDPTIQVINPPPAEAVTCAQYEGGCLSVSTLQLKELDFLVVEFLTEKEAINASKKVGAYYFLNFMLDDVAGEPILEKFATEKLQVKKP